jgi:hypothetical protein
VALTLLTFRSSWQHSIFAHGRLMNMKKIRAIVYRLFVLLGIGIVSFAGCSEQLPVMTVAQQTTYNDCMKGRWSGAADTFWWGPFGWAYHSSVAKDCLAKSGSVGESDIAEAAPATAAGGVQPASTSATAAMPKAQPSPSSSAY